MKKKENEKNRKKKGKETHTGTLPNDKETSE